MSGFTALNISILFVDDEPNILSSLKRELHGWDDERGVKVLTAGSATDALVILEKFSESIGVVVSDLKMPRMLGSDFLLEVRKKYPDIVTILLTGYSETPEVMKAISAGIFSYILKPWDPDYLRSELDKALDLRKMKLDIKLHVKRIEEELRWAGEMQRAILKPNLSSTRGVEFRVSYRPVPELYCGGDYYDVINLPGGKYLILVGDVAGHGIKGAFITGILKAIIYPEYLRNHSKVAFSPADFLAWLNERMNFELRRSSGLFVTLFAAEVDPDAKTLRYANAGHPQPYILSAWSRNRLDICGPPLGFAPNQKYEERAESLKQGDLLFIYTDGLVECGLAEGTGNVSLEDILGSEPAGEDYHRRVIAAALSAAGVPEFSDDLTLLTMQVQ